MRMTRLLLGLALGAAPAVAVAQGSPFDLDALRHLARIGDLSLSADGRWIATTVSRPNYETNRRMPELIVVDVRTGAIKSLSRDRMMLFSPAWSPSGDRLAFLSEGAGDGTGPQVWVIPIDGGEARRITNAREGVEQFAWRPDGKAIAYASADTAVRRDGEERHNDSFEIGDDDYLIRVAAAPVHLWVVSDTGGPPRRITSGSWSLARSDATSAFGFSPKGDQITATTQASAHSGAFGKAVASIIDVETGVTKAVGSLFGLGPSFSPDGKTILFSRNRGVTPYFSSHGLTVADLATGAERFVTSTVDRNFYGGAWQPDGQILASADDGTTVSVWRFTQGGTATRLDLGGIQPAGELRPGPDGSYAFVGITPTTYHEIYWSDRSSPPRKLTDLNSTLGRYALGRSEGIEWDVEKGVRADGVVTYPPNVQPGRKYPLVLWIHGGPMGASTTGFSELIQLYAAQGWLVLQPNYRGSVNRGNQYQSAIIGDAGAGPGRDVMAGVRALIARGLVDTTRMAVSGWSYGGYMTTWLIGHYQGWKAAVAGAALTDYGDSYNLSDISVTFGNGWGGSPWSDKFEALVRDQSPINHWRTMRTPTLILSNTGDVRVPIVQSFKLYHALKDQGVPVQFIAYPIGGHFPNDPVRIRDVFRRAVDWIKARFGP